MPTDSTRLEAVSFQGTPGSNSLSAAPEGVPSLKGLGVWAIFVPGTAVPGFHMPRLRHWVPGSTEHSPSALGEAKGRA